MKHTKRALLLSVLSLILCFSMMLGTTYAWFTDSVTSAGNKIQSGTLKMDLSLYDGTDYVSIKEDQTALFSYQKWEPGYVEVKLLEVKNLGSLALKWKAKFVSNVALSDLATVIDVYVCPSATKLTELPDRDLAGYTYAGTLAEFVNTIESTTYGVLEEKDEVAYLGIALKMQETAGNEYQDLTIGAFDIQIVATQMAYEEDSIDENYDETAPLD